MKIRHLLLALTAAFSFGLAGCEFGTVDQGRAVAFDEKAGTVALVLDANHDQLNPDYSGGIVVFKIPVDPKEMGPAPKPGGRLKLDIDKNQIIIYNYATKATQAVPVQFLDVKKDVRYDDPLVSGKKFPVVDKATGTITEYSARQRVLCTFKVPQDLMSLSPATWEAGDEVRIYFKKPGEALRLMNINKTNIYKR